MNDRVMSFLESYPVKVKQISRGRGSYIVQTEEGLKILKEFKGGEKKAESQYEVLSYLKNEKNFLTDCYIRNVEGKFIVADWTGTQYVLKDWYHGKECDVKKKEELYKAVCHLAALHKELEGYDISEVKLPHHIHISEKFEKNNCEIKKIYTFIKNKNQKSQFEKKYLECFEMFYRQGRHIREKSKGFMEGKKQICHGEFNQHNVLVGEKTIITNFDHLCIDSKILDIYQFLRKIMEKYHWKEELFQSLLDHYEKINPLSKEEKRELYYRLAYPEKFWKLANYYYQKKKVWISDKNCEKLEMLICQEKEKENLLLRKKQSLFED